MRLLWPLLLVGCATTAESGARASFAASAWTPPAASTLELDGTLAGYTALAVAQHPALIAAYERWRQSALSISAARRLPEPMLGVSTMLGTHGGGFGLTELRLRLEQAFPWPTRLSAAADAASAEARALERRFDAEALVVAQRVADAYWALWWLRRKGAIQVEHLELMRGLAETGRARIVTGAAGLAAQQQIDLRVARLEDGLAAIAEEERAAAAGLRSALGLREEVEVPTRTDPGLIAGPGEDHAALVEAALAHPMITAHGFMAEAAESMARMEEAHRYPGFALGAEYMLDARDDLHHEVMLMTGVMLPLWQESYASSADAARAGARAARAERRASEDRAIAELEMAMSKVRDAIRRVKLYEGTLIPQAESAYASALGVYAAGEGMVAETLDAQAELLDLRAERDRARSIYARAWARLERIAGRAVEREGTR